MRARALKDLIIYDKYYVHKGYEYGISVNIKDDGSLRLVLAIDEELVYIDYASRDEFYKDWRLRNNVTKCMTVQELVSK